MRFLKGGDGMPKVVLNAAQRRDYKVRDFKGWVVKQMKLNGKRQVDVAEVLGVSVGRVSQMLKIPDKGCKAKVNPDPFSYGQVLALCELFEVDDDERRKLLTM